MLPRPARRHRDRRVGRDEPQRRRFVEVELARPVRRAHCPVGASEPFWSGNMSLDQIMSLEEPAVRCGPLLNQLIIFLVYGVSGHLDPVIIAIAKVNL